MNYSISKSIIAVVLAIIPSFIFAQHTEHFCAKSKINIANAWLSKTQNEDYPLSLLNKYDVKHYWLNLNVERTSTYISGNVRIASEVLANMDTFAFELHDNFTIDSVVIDGISTFAYQENNVAYVTTNKNAGDNIKTTIYYKGTPPSGAGAAIGNGFSNGTSGSWGNQVTWSLSQPYAALEWFPCKQQLKDKADSAWVFITTDTSNLAGSNGVLTQIVNLGNGKHRFEWKSNYPISYYLISVAVAKYIDYSIYAKPAALNGDSILIQNYIYNNPNTLPYFKEDIDETKDMLEAFSDLFGLYPFYEEKYGHSMAPLGGGMEHQTMTTQGFFDFTLTAHELGHQWFGDNVTCKSWQDIWVNEGFASYSEYLALEKLYPSDAASWMSSTHNSVMGQSAGSVFVPDTTVVNRIFDSRLTYDKGAAILHSIRFEINNDSLFFAALKNYQTIYNKSVAGSEDFKAIVETTSGIDFTQFFNQWYYGQGYPTFATRWNYLNNTFIVKSTQTVSATSITPLFKTPIEYRLARTIGGDTIVRVYQTQSVQFFEIPVSGNVIGIQIDPRNGILNKTSGTIKDNTLVLALQNNELVDDNRIYPNPTTEGFSIYSEIENSEILITDMLGKIVMKSNLKKGDNFVKTNKLNSGVYLIYVNDKIQKLVVN